MGLNLDNINFTKTENYKNKKKLILFGTGIVCKKFLSNFDKSRVLFIVDNNKSLWGSKFEGIEIKNPNSLKNLKKAEIVIILYSYRYVYISGVHYVTGGETRLPSAPVVVCTGLC